MAYEITGQTLGTLDALNDFSSSSAQFTLVKTTSAADFSQQVTAGGWVLGVLQNRPSTGQTGSIMVTGITKVRVHSTAAAVVAGEALTATTSAGVEAVANALSSFVIGRALEASSTTQIITMLLRPEGGGSTAA